MSEYFHKIGRSIGTGVTAIGNRSGSRGWIAQIAKQSVFIGGTFDYVTNLWLDTSGNDNHAELKEASARTSLSGSLDYIITGILTTDTIEVVSGSDTPTIPVNGTLRISEGQTVYGVTIKRGGEIWAVFPFCEPIITDQYGESYPPTYSYDVSGNNRAAKCLTISAGNITTQDNYFYLQENGCAIGGKPYSDGWKFTDSNADGLPDNWTKGAGVNISYPEGDKYVRISLASGVGSFPTDKYIETTQDTDSNAIGVKYILRYKLRSNCPGGSPSRIRFLSRRNFDADYYFTRKGQATIKATLYPAGHSEWLEDWKVVTVWDNENVAFRGTKLTLDFMIEQGTYIDFEYLYLCPLTYSPGVENTTIFGKSLDAEQNGKRWIANACSLKFPDGIQVNPQTYVIENNSTCISGKSYFVESTSDERFGVGVNEVFVSDGSEILDLNNTVREVLSITPLSGNVKNHILRGWHAHFLYQHKVIGFHRSDFHKYPITIASNVNSLTTYGRDFARTFLYSDNLVILKKGVFISNEEHLKIRRHIGLTAEYFKQATFIQDHGVKVNGLDVLIPALGSRRMTISANYGFHSTVSEFQAYKANGFDIITHTADKREGLPTGLYKNFHDTTANYTEQQLRDYYSAAKELHENLYGNTSVKVYPGGAFDRQTQENVLNYWQYAFPVGSFVLRNVVPLVDLSYIGRYSYDNISFNGMQAYFNANMPYDNLFVAYFHIGSAIIPTTELDDDGNASPGSGEYWHDKFIKHLDYIESQGYKIVKMQDVFKIMENLI